MREAAFDNRRMSLSVVCATRDPGPQVAALLSQLRGVADEVVVAADSRVDGEDLSEYNRVADILVRYEYTGSNRSFAWLHGLCSGDWIFHISGDEVAAPAFIERLPELTAARDVQQYWLPTRWTFPDGAHWLDELPWYPDFHNRLIRNDGTLRFPGLKHSGAAPALPARYIEEPLYHLNLSLISEQERRAKVERYERELPDLRAPGGAPFNAAYYLPEDHARGAPVPVPERDRNALAAVLQAAPAGAEPLDPAAVPLATAAEITAAWSGRQFAPDGYRARIRPIERDLRMYMGEHRAIHVEVANEGSESWHWDPALPPDVRVSYRWLGEKGRVVEAEGLRTEFPCSVGPGERCIVPAVVIAPGEPGDYVLELDLVHEPVRWFGCRAPVPMRVEPLRATARPDARPTPR